jgi:hypothetical protein
VSEFEDCGTVRCSMVEDLREGCAEVKFEGRVEDCGKLKLRRLVGKG